MSRILAIDYGRKRIGLALSDELGLRRNRSRRWFTRIAAMISPLREICRQHEVGRIVVGPPLHMTGEAGDMAEEAKRLCSAIRKGSST